MNFLFKYWAIFNISFKTLNHIMDALQKVSDREKRKLLRAALLLQSLQTQLQILDLSKEKNEEKAQISWCGKKNIDEMENVRLRNKNKGLGVINRHLEEENAKLVSETKQLKSQLEAAKKEASKTATEVEKLKSRIAKAEWMLRDSADDRWGVQAMTRENVLSHFDISEQEKEKFRKSAPLILKRPMTELEMKFKNPTYTTSVPDDKIKEEVENTRENSHQFSPTLSENHPKALGSEDYSSRKKGKEREKVGKEKVLPSPVISSRQPSSRHPYDPVGSPISGGIGDGSKESLSGPSSGIALKSATEENKNSKQIKRSEKFSSSSKADEEGVMNRVFKLLEKLVTSTRQPSSRHPYGSEGPPDSGGIGDGSNESVSGPSDGIALSMAEDKKKKGNENISTSMVTEEGYMTRGVKMWKAFISMMMLTSDDEGKSEVKEHENYSKGDK